MKNKKLLAARVFNVGVNKIKFNPNRINEISEAITRQDMIDLHNAGAIIISENHGRKKVEKRKRRRNAGKVKKVVFNRKRDYIIITRKLRNYAVELRKQNKISEEKHQEIRRKIKTRNFKSKAQLKEYLKV